MAQKVTILLLPYFCELVLATFDERFVYGCWGTSEKKPPAVDEAPQEKNK